MRRSVWAIAAAVVAALSACGGSEAGTTPAVTATPPPTPSTTTAGGAMAGFLAAARVQDNARVPSWLATATDTSDLAEVLNVYGSFGAGGTAGLFWAVRSLRITAVAGGDASHADITLSGDIVWCLGTAAGDPMATCAAISGEPGRPPHTYAAMTVGGRWKVDVDINASSQLDHNPQASPPVGAPTPSPT